MIAEKYIRHYNALQGNKISRKALAKFHAALKKDIDSGRIDAHVPYGVELLDIEKRLANGLKKINGHIMRVEIKPIKIKAHVVTAKPNIDKKSKKKKKSKESFKPKSRGKSKRVVESPKSERENKKSPQPQVERKEHSQAIAEISKPTKKLHGVVDAQTLAGIAYSTFDIAPEWKKEFHKINSDSVLMIWGKPGSGKTVKLLKLAQHLSMDLKKKVLYIAEEEYGRSTLADKLIEHKIGNANLSFAPDLDAGIINSFDAIFLDSVNSMQLSPADVKNLIRKYPGKLWVLIVQTTKEGDFRGGRDWEHLVDIAGEVVNRKMILRKNRLDPNNKAKADKLLVEEIVAEKKQAEQIKQLVKASEQKPNDN